MDGIAYICAYEKGPRCVTAAALEQTPQGIMVWLAANENIEDTVIQFLEKVLFDIQRIAKLDDRESRQRKGEQMLENLISRIVAFNAPRVQTYYEQVTRRHAPVCLDIISRACVKEGTSKYHPYFCIVLFLLVLKWPNIRPCCPEGTISTRSPCGMASWDLYRRLLYHA